MALYLAKIRGGVEKEERIRVVEEQRAQALQNVMNGHADGNQDANENHYVDERREIAAAVNEGCSRHRIEQQIEKRLEARRT